MQEPLPPRRFFAVLFARVPVDFGRALGASLLTLAACAVGVGNDFDAASDQDDDIADEQDAGIDDEDPSAVDAGDAHDAAGSGDNDAGSSPSLDAGVGKDAGDSGARDAGNGSASDTGAPVGDTGVDACTTCDAFEASNVDVKAINFSALSAKTINCALTITSTGTNLGAMLSSTSCGLVAGDLMIVSQAGGPDLVVVKSKDLTVSANVRLIGDKPVVFVADGNVIINSGATIDASSSRAGTGNQRGAGGSYAMCNAGLGKDGNGNNGADDGAGGASGAGFSTAGGAGGRGDDGQSVGAVASAADGNAMLVPLRGGCKGGDGADGWVGNDRATGGGGGGALQISAHGTITVAGTITAGGGAGDPGDGDEDSGGGGGSGGAILLEAGSGTPSITGALRAHGGGGGGGASTWSDRGEAGADGAAGPATGGVGGSRQGASAGGKGGAGGSATAANMPGSNGSAGDPGQNDSPHGGGGGGGGGGAGRIVVR